MKKILNLRLILLLVLSVALQIFGSAYNTSCVKGQEKPDGLVFYGGFEEEWNDSLKKAWGIPWVSREKENRIVKEAYTGKRSLRVSYPEGGLGPGGTGMQFPLIFRNMNGAGAGLYRELYLRYYVKFEEGFDFNKGGKLPGLMGGGDSWVRSGGNQPDGSNGWTLRFMWRKEGEIVVYAYVPKTKDGKWGSETWGQDISCNFKAQPGRWHCIEQYVNVGTPGKSNGRLKVWIDGKERLNVEDMLFWTKENDNGLIGGIYFSTFHGGNTPDWAPRHDSYALFDGIAASGSRIGEEGSWLEQNQ